MNRNLILLMFVIFLVGCKEKRAPKITEITTLIASVDILSNSIPDRIVNRSDLFYDTKNSIWTLNNELYSGYVVSYYQKNTLKEKFGILNGKKQNQAIQWYSDGNFREQKNYHLGKLHGDKKSWLSDSTHILISHLKYVDGKPHGEQKKYYPTGELFKKLNLNMGQEEGLQQAFRKNGALFANYEAREGRIFGLKKSKLCFQLDDEEVQY